MKHLNKILLTGFLLIIALPLSVFPDTYPKNPNIDVINYIFKLELSDKTDEITGEATIEVNFLVDGIRELRLDLINQSKDLNGKGMLVSSAASDGKAVEFRHENNALFIKLPAPSKANRREKCDMELS